MNKAHEMCGSDEWRAAIRDMILPWALGEVDLGADVLEVGPGYGAVTDVLSTLVPRLTSVEIDPELVRLLRGRFAGAPSVTIVDGDATALAFDDESFTGAVCFTMLHHVPTIDGQDRLFAEVARALRPGAALVASDSGMHDGDTYNPVDPQTLPARLARAGFTDIAVKTNEFGWGATARKAAT